MRIGLISDTHGDIDAWQKALELFKDIDFAIHTGDILSSGPFNPRGPSYKPAELAAAINSAPFPSIFAKGNCDAEIDERAIDFPIEPRQAFVFAGGLRIMATHGHLYDEDQLASLGKRYRLDLIVRGHTHERGIRERDGMVMVNPGSVSLPKSEDEIPSIGIIDNRTIRILSVNDGTELERIEL